MFLGLTTICYHGATVQIEPGKSIGTSVNGQIQSDCVRMEGASGPGDDRSRRHHRHGLVRLKRAVKVLGGRVIDNRTTLGKALTAWKAGLISDLGGDVSTQQAAIIDLAVKTKLLLDSIDAWLLTQPSLVNARKRALIPVVRERQALADALARYMGQLGLERRARPVPDLTAYLATKAAQPPPEPGAELPG